MTKRELLNAGVRLVVSVGVGAIVGNAVAFTTPVLAIGVLKRTCIGIGSFAMSCMVSDKVADYAEEKVNAALDEVQKFAKEADQDVKEEATA